MLCQQSPQPILNQSNYPQSINFNSQATLNTSSDTFNFNVGSDTSINLDIDTSFGDFISHNDMTQLLANENNSGQVPVTSGFTSGQQRVKQEVIAQPASSQQQRPMVSEQSPSFSNSPMSQEFIQGQQPVQVSTFQQNDQNYFRQQNFDQNNQQTSNYQVLRIKIKIFLNFGF
jgi:hypothetical protein